MEEGRKGYSRDGYIVDQARLTDVPFGCRTSDYNGCGWIAAYNLLRSLGREASVPELTAALSRRSLFRGLLGTSPFKLVRYLKARDLRVRVAFGKRKAAALAEHARQGVLLYRHKLGWHYIAFTRAGEDGALRFFNASPGDERHIEPLPLLLERDSVAPLLWLLSVEEEAR